MGSILQEAAANFENMSVDDLKAHLKRIAEQRQKQKEHQKQYNSTPEAAGKRKEYQTKRLEALKADPTKYDALRAKRKEYMNRPAVVAKRKEYHSKRNATLKAILAEAKKRGLDVNAMLAETSAGPTA